MEKKKTVRQHVRELWKKLWRWFFTLPMIQWIVAFLIYMCFRLVQVTCRIRYKNKKVFKQIKGRPVIYAFWHGRSMMLSGAVKRYGYKGYAIFSRHRDGRLMAKLQLMFGLRGIYGSTGRRGAVQVLREGVRVLNEGSILCLSPDGPKGPRMRIHDGVLYFAKMTGAPIVPICFSCNRPWFQDRWDKYLIATPFSKILIDAGDPFYIGKGDDMEIARAKLEKIMVEQLWRTDAEFGLPKIKQGEKKI